MLKSQKKIAWRIKFLVVLAPVARFGCTGVALPAALRLPRDVGPVAGHVIPEVAGVAEQHFVVIVGLGTGILSSIGFLLLTCYLLVHFAPSMVNKVYAWTTDVFCA